MAIFRSEGGKVKLSQEKFGDIPATDKELEKADHILIAIATGLGFENVVEYLRACLDDHIEVRLRLNKKRAEVKQWPDEKGEQDGI